MQTYIAHYRSPNASGDRAMGLFEFESSARAGSKANLHDARVHMLETFGSKAVSWTIEKVERKKVADVASDGQLALDFREPLPEKKRKRKTTDRGKV